MGHMRLYRDDGPHQVKLYSKRYPSVATAASTAGRIRVARPPFSIMGYSGKIFVFLAVFLCLRVAFCSFALHSHQLSHGKRTLNP